MSTCASDPSHGMYIAPYATLNEKCPANNSTKLPPGVVLVHTRLSWNTPEADWTPQFEGCYADTPGVGSDSDLWCLMERIEMSKGASVGSMIAGLVKVEASSGSAGEIERCHRTRESFDKGPRNLE